jgi:prevent-host-death family protein
MNSTWQLQEAKSRLSELVENAVRQGAQTITRHGRPVAVVVSVEEFAQLQPRKKTVDVLRECPEPNLIVERLCDRPQSLKF